MRPQTRVLVVGGGPAGMMAAISAARAGARVLLLERNEKLGKKLYITGKGRCNVTTACERDAFFASIARNARFLYSAYANFSNQRLIAFLEDAGLPLKVERGMRVFPASDKASDVTRTLARALEKAQVALRMHARAAELIVREGRAAGVVLEDGEKLSAGAVILATGGLSYPVTGSTGDGYRMARQTGHALTATRPCLVALMCQDPWTGTMPGLALRNVVLRAKQGKKRLFEEQGELLFTHDGISGPLALSLSARLPDTNLAQVQAEIDLKPALDAQKLDVRLVRDFGDMARKQFKSVAEHLAPRAMAPVLCALSGIAPDTPVHQISRGMRARLLDALKHFPVHISGFHPIEEAIITRGGVAVSDIRPKDMMSKRTEGLFFAGEMIDVDGYTGGFNLQIAFSTGHLAGASAAQYVLDDTEASAL